MTPSSEEIQAHIDKSMLFRTLSPQARTAIANISIYKGFSTGDKVLKEGSRVEGLSLIVEGMLRVSTRALPGDSMELKILRPGSWFGEVGFLSKKPATATLVAATDGAALVLPTEALEGLLDPYPQVRVILERLALRRAEDTIEKTLKRLSDD